MARWFRVYDDIINDPKIIKLPEETRWHWVAILCIASKNGGALPSTEDVAISLRVKPSNAAAIIAALASAGLLDKQDGAFIPHNWQGRQYKSDVSTERVKRFRKRERNNSETFHERSTKPDETVSETPPETDTDTESETDTEQSSAVAARSSRRKPKLPMPDIFPLSERNRIYAGEKGLGDRAEQIFTKFKNYHQSKGSVFASWDAAWRTWVDNEISFKKSSDDDVYRNVL